MCTPFMLGAMFFCDWLIVKSHMFVSNLIIVTNGWTANTFNATSRMHAVVLPSGENSNCHPMDHLVVKFREEHLLYFHYYGVLSPYFIIML